MGFRRLPVEETSYDNSHIGAMRDISELVREEEGLNQQKRESAARESRERNDAAQSEMLGGFQRGAENLFGGIQKNKQLAREEARLERQEARADRAEGRQQEEFDLSKPEKQMLADTAGKRVALGIEGQEAGIQASKAGARQSTVQADSMEREEAIMNAPAVGPDVRQGETNRIYMQRLEREGRQQDLAFKREQLAEQIAGRPMRENLMRSQIAGQNAQTESAQIANRKAREDEEIRRFTAIASNPTPEQMQSLPAGLAAGINSGQIPVEKVPMVLAAMKENASQAQMKQNLMNQTDPRFQKDLQVQFDAEDKAKLYTDAISGMSNYLTQNKANSILNDEGSREGFARFLDDMGMNKEAENVRSKLSDISDTVGAGFSMDNLMKSYLNKAKAIAKSQFKTEAEKKNPKVQAMLANIDSFVGADKKLPYDLFGGQNAAPQQPILGQTALGQMQPGQFQVGGQRFDTQGNNAAPASPLAPIPGTTARPRPAQVGKK